MQRRFHFSGMRAQECPVWVVWWAHVQFCKQLPTLFPSLAVLLHSHQSCASDLVSSHAHQHLVLPLFFVLAILISVWSPNALWFQSTSFRLMVLSIFLCVSLPSLCPPLQNVCSCLFGLFVLLLMRLESSFIYARCKSFVRYVVSKTFLPVYSLSFQSLNRVFRKAKVLIFDEVQFIGFSSCRSCFWCQVSELCLNLGPEDFLLSFFKKFFSLSLRFFLIKVNLQRCVSFKCTAKWFSYTYL